MKSIRSNTKEQTASGEKRDFTYELCEIQSTGKLKFELETITGMACQQHIYKSQEWLSNFHISGHKFIIINTVPKYPSYPKTALND